MVKIVMMDQGGGRNKGRLDGRKREKDRSKKLANQDRLTDKIY
jgi:hypothetical protein